MDNTSRLKLKSELEQITNSDIYAYNPAISNISANIGDDRDTEDYVVCCVKDNYGIEHKTLIYVGNTFSDSSIDSIKDCFKSIVNGITAVQYLNDLIHDSEAESGISIKFVYTLESAVKSFVYDWDYDSLTIAIARKSAEQLFGIDRETIASIVSEINMNIPRGEFKTVFNSILDQSNSSLAKIINLQMQEYIDNDRKVMDSLSGGMFLRDDLINELKMTYSSFRNNKYTETGWSEYKSVLCSSELGIIARFNWLVSLSRLEIKIELEDSKYYSTFDNEFITDIEKCSGLESVYKLSVSEYSYIFNLE